MLETVKTHQTVKTLSPTLSILKNFILGDEVTFAYMYCSAQPCLASCQSLAYLLGFVPWLGSAEPVT